MPIMNQARTHARKNARGRQSKRNKAIAMAHITSIISGIKMAPSDRSDFLSDLSALSCTKLRDKAITIAALIDPSPPGYPSKEGSGVKRDAITTRFILTSPVIPLAHRNSAETPSRFRFLELPAELRLRIYEYAMPLVWEEQEHCRNRPKPVDMLNWYYPSVLASEPVLLKYVLCISQQNSEEKGSQPKS
ncbi:hypothetical protein HII31_11907 [Pseudocercospora fuligena]|uniref:Uncharacterized protein n=1 Tax=Pseudocercospora fuligena TaxID=685502 RepID=A0A8H6R7D7_9PEZI|nr:hypothetical protein HII31_11907 [Pseudocercospora fuligena]